MILYEDDFYKLFIKENKVYIQVYAENIDLYELRDIINRHPRITNLDFMKLRNASILVDEEPMAIGDTRSMVEIQVSADCMKAFLRLYVTAEEFANKRKEINQEINTQLENNGISYGVKSYIFNEEYDYKKDVILAEGLLPQNGIDAKIKYIEIEKTEPEIAENGSVNFYNVELYKSVAMGDWLGTMILSTEGIDGKNIKGEVLAARSGKSSRLRFDSKTVRIIEEKDQQTLSAKIDGIVEFKNGKIGIANHLVIPENVDYETGNIDFKGYLTIKGIVEDGFSVKADNDIMIQGELGLGAVDKIESRLGSVFIKGGVYGKNRAIIKARDNIFIKHINQAKLKCKGNISVGFYVFNSLLDANSVEVTSLNGRIIGGKTIVKSRIKAQYIGNKKELVTKLYVEGFNRKQINVELIDILKEYKEKLKLLEYNKKALNIIEASDGKTVPLDYKKLKVLVDKLLYEVSELENKRTILNNYLKAKGEGSVEIIGFVYPRTSIRIKNIELEIKESSRGTYYYDDYNIKIEER